MLYFYNKNVKKKIIYRSFIEYIKHISITFCLPDQFFIINTWYLL